MNIDRRTYRERRQANLNLVPNKLERRKRPDRRTGGFDVGVLMLSEEDFSFIFSHYLVRSK